MPIVPMARAAAGSVAPEFIRENGGTRHEDVCCENSGRCADSGRWPDGGSAGKGRQLQRCDDEGACTETTQAAGKACLLGTQSDYWIAVGICNNKPNEAQRETCIDEAGDARREAVVLCGEQFEARDDLCDMLGEAPYAPRINPANFVARINNPFLPLRPGSRWVYRGDTEDGLERVVVSVLDETETILGVRCTVVRDTVTIDGELVEDTIDWYAQDRAGNVWYFGEISKSFEDGRLVSLDGSWRAGVDGAKPGIVMQAHPRVGQVYRQEFLLGVAEDYARVVTLAGNASVPAASCTDCLVTGDFVPLEPDADERKYYKRGVGFILEIDRTTGDRIELIQYQAP